MMPAVAFRIEHAGEPVVLSGDVQSECAGLVTLAEDCDVLVCDLALPERQVPTATCTPSRRRAGG